MLEFSIIDAEFAVSLYEVVQFPRGHSDLIRVTEGGFQNFDSGFDVLQGNFIGLEIWLNLVLGITLKVTINIAKLVLVIRKATILSC
jgi:hypothetical protein